MATKLQGATGRMVKTYLMLTCTAGRRETITYGEIANATRVAPPGVGKSCLDPVAAYCEANNFPDITVIAVQDKTGLPAPEHFDPSTITDDWERVYDFPWTDYAPPAVSG